MTRSRKPIRRNSGNQAKQNSSTRRANTSVLDVANQDVLKSEAEKKRLKFLKQLRAAQRSLERFEQKDIPQFEQWKAARFGTRLSEIRELEIQARELAMLIDEVEREQFISGLPYHDCYNNILRWREHPEERPKPDNDAQRGRSRSGNPFDDIARDIFESIFGDQSDDWDDGFEDEEIPFGRTRQGSHFDDFPSQPSAFRKADPNGECKKLYRQLARKLHPDHREDLGSFDADRLDTLWHETQVAYKNGSIEELERIDALIDIEANGVSQQTELESIEQVAEHHRRSLRAVERSIRQSRKHPAWMFSKKPKIKAELELFIDFELEENRSDILFDLAEMRHIVDRWEQVPRVRKAKKKAHTPKSKKRKAPKIPEPKAQPQPIQEELFSNVF